MVGLPQGIAKATIAGQETWTPFVPAIAAAAPTLTRSYDQWRRRRLGGPQPHCTRSVPTAWQRDMLRSYLFPKARVVTAAALSTGAVPDGGPVGDRSDHAVVPPGISPRAGEAGGSDGVRAFTSPPDIHGAIRHIHAMLAALATRISSVESRFSLAAWSLSGLGALQAVVAHEHHRTGRGLAACARAVLIEKLHVCPPKRRANSGCGSLAQSSVRVEVVCTLAALEELLDIKEMVYSAVKHRLPGRQSLKVHVKSFQELAEALSLTPSMQAEVLVRSFRRGDESRVLVEHIKTDAGRVLYILERRSATQEVKIATRENEMYDGRLRRFLSTLDVKILKNIDLPELPTEYPLTMTWTENLHGVASTVVGHHLAAGKLVLTVPVSVVQGRAVDLVAHLTQ